MLALHTIGNHFVHNRGLAISLVCHLTEQCLKLSRTNGALVRVENAIEGTSRILGHELSVQEQAASAQLLKVFPVHSLTPKREGPEHVHKLAVDVYPLLRWDTLQSLGMWRRVRPETIPGKSILRRPAKSSQF